jgi:hypothetical protein
MRRDAALRTGVAPLVESRTTFGFMQDLMLACVP